MNRRDEIRAAVAALAHRPVESVNSDTRLTEDMGLRSLARVELAVRLEEALHCTVPDTAVLVARTVGDLEAKLGA